MIRRPNNKQFILIYMLNSQESVTRSYIKVENVLSE